MDFFERIVDGVRDIEKFSRLILLVSLVGERRFVLVDFAFKECDGA